MRGAGRGPCTAATALCALRCVCSLLATRTCKASAPSSAAPTNYRHRHSGPVLAFSGNLSPPPSPLPPAICDKQLIAVAAWPIPLLQPVLDSGLDEDAGAAQSVPFSSFLFFLIFFSCSAHYTTTPLNSALRPRSPPSPPSPPVPLLPFAGGIPARGGPPCPPCPPCGLPWPPGGLLCGLPVLAAKGPAVSVCVLHRGDKTRRACRSGANCSGAQRPALPCPLRWECGIYSGYLPPGDPLSLRTTTQLRALACSPA